MKYDLDSYFESHPRVLDKEQMDIGGLPRKRGLMILLRVQPQACEGAGFGEPAIFVLLP